MNYSSKVKTYVVKVVESVCLELGGLPIVAAAYTRIIEQIHGKLQTYHQNFLACKRAVGHIDTQL